MLVGAVPAGDYNGTVVTEGGLYVLNAGSEKHGSIDADFVLEKLATESPLPITWNSLEVMGNPTFTMYPGTELEMEFIKISDTIPSVEQFNASKLTGIYNGIATVAYSDGALVSDDGFISASFMTEPDEHNNQTLVFMFGCTAPGEYSNDGVTMVIPEAGLYAHNDGAYGASVDYVLELATPSNDNIFPISWNTSKVTGNATVEVTGLPLVKVSDKLPSFEQLQQSFMTMSENGITKMSLVSDIAEDSSDAYGGTYLFDGSGDVVVGLVFLFVFTNPGEVYGAYIPEAGIYVMNEGTDTDYTLDILKSGLYSSGTLMKTWQELLNENIIHIDNGSVYTNATLSDGNSSSSELSDVLILPDDGTITKLGTFNLDTFEGNMAFSSCTELTYIYLPANIKEIGALDFVGCTSLKAIVSLANIETIGYRAFGDCSSFTGGAGELHLNSIISISQYAFQNCSSLVEVHLGCNLTKIDAGAFLNCSNLRSLHFDGTIEQWNNIELGNDWCYGTQITGVICADGSIDFT